MHNKILLTWSGGKDSALALYELRKNFNYEITALLTTVTIGYERVSMHGVQRTLLEEQAAAVDLPLETVYLNKKSSNEEYESCMAKKLTEYKLKEVRDVAFGDIFLEDVRKYREDNLARLEMSAVFPLWRRNTRLLAGKFVELGFKAIITCVDTEQLDGQFAGRLFDTEFLAELPTGVDPCGENGEFHSFVFDGPIFTKQVGFEKGEAVLKDNRFNYFELIPLEK